MVAISGASGMLYAHRLLQVLPPSYGTVYLTASDNALGILRSELGCDSLAGLVPAGEEARFRELDPGDLSAPPASGSHDYDGLVVIPCSMGLCGRIAAGVSNDLVTRAADVCLKERRKLILVIRESPLSLVHLRNLAALAEAGAVIMPASPAFYSGAREIGDLVDFIVDRVLRALGETPGLLKGWGE